MIPDTKVALAQASETPHHPSANWVANASLLWDCRKLLASVTAVTLVLSLAFAFLLPKQYESVARIMPPDQQSSGGTALLAAVAGRSLGGLGGLAGSLLGGRNTSALFIDLLHSRTLSDHIIDRFNLDEVYHKRYRIDTVKYLAHHTTVVDDKRSGVITLTYTDLDPVRAREIAQAYLEGLNLVLTQSNTSSAKSEREFIERRLIAVKEQLTVAEKSLSEFSSVNATLDIKEQTQAMFGASAKLQGEVIVAQSELSSIQQIYGDDNVRVHAAKARLASLQGELRRLSGSSEPLPGSEDSGNSQLIGSSALYPSLRQIPRLAVPYAALYRNVRVQEAVFELLSQEYEAARISEAKDTPVVSVFDPPLVAEKKSFPPRLLIGLATTAAVDIAACFFLLLRKRWELIDRDDPRRELARQIAARFNPALRRMRPTGAAR